MTATIKQMERQYGLRYERGAWGLFPVTHRLTGPCGDMGDIAAWGLVSIGNLEVLNWQIIDATGNLLVHGTEQNFARTRSGYYQMIRRGLKRVRNHGAIRVYPRHAEDRAVRFETSRRWAPKAGELRP